MQSYLSTEPGPQRADQCTLVPTRCKPCKIKIADIEGSDQHDDERGRHQQPLSQGAAGAAAPKRPQRSGLDPNVREVRVTLGLRENLEYFAEAPTGLITADARNESTDRTGISKSQLRAGGQCL